MESSATLGQRIQEGRKSAGLSQEALGEQLGVSRQAVSKWESDAAVPELENLIAMSRIFGVSIGTLLGVDPPEVPEREHPLSEKELAAVEAIAAKYLSETEQFRPRRSRRQKVMAILAAVLAGALVLTLCVQMRRMERQFRGVQDQVNNIRDDMAWQISGITGQISDILGEQENLLADSAVDVTDYDLTAGTVTLSVSVLPKERTEDTAASFTARLSDGRTFTAEGTLSGNAYAAENWVIPMDYHIDLSVALSGGGTVRTGPVETLYDCGPGNFRPLIDFTWGASWSSGSSSVKLNTFALTIQPSRAGAPDLTAVDLCFYRSGSAAPERVIPVEEAVELSRTAGMVEMSHISGYETSLELAPGDDVVIAVRVRDSHGQTFYGVGSVFQAGEQGGIDSLFGADNWADWTPGTPVRSLADASLSDGQSGTRYETAMPVV